MKERMIKGMPDFLLVLLIVAITTVSPVLGIIAAVLFYGVAVTYKPGKQAPENVEVEVNYTVQQFVYLDQKNQQNQQIINGG